MVDGKVEGENDDPMLGSAVQAPNSAEERSCCVLP